jgi:apolipoprotein N-acyltransferase
LFETHRRSASLMPLLWAVLAGVLQAASLAWPCAVPDALGFLGLLRGQPVWWLQWLSLAALLPLLWRSRTAGQAAARGWVFTVAWLAATFAWLYVSMHTYGGLPAPLAVIAVLALAAALALYYGAVCWLFWHLALINKVLSALVFAALWVLAEMARGQWLTGFGWGAVGYAQLDGPLAPLLAWVGIYGVTFCSALVAALLAVLVNQTSPRYKAAALALLLALMVVPRCLPVPKGADSGALSVTLLQGNIAQEEKFEPATGVLQALRWYGGQLQANRSELIVTPETALAVLPEQLPDGYWHALQQRFARGEQAALVGMPLNGAAGGYNNAVVGFKPGQASPWRYDKFHLVPFGEFIPPMFRWFIDMMNIPLGDFNRGALPQASFDWHGQRLATSICYENLFSEEMGLQFADAQTAPTILVNLSNLGWFGEHLAMDQHLLIARTRALEFDRPLLLATNTGHTAIVSRQGLVTDALAPHTAAALSGTVQGRTGVTPYAVWVSRFGQWPVWLLAIGMVLAASWLRWRSPQR